MPTPRIAVIAFPGNNCEVESMRAVRKAGMEAVYVRWNQEKSSLQDIDGYFLVGGFAYEDRGRSGMVAGRDPLMDFIGQEAEQGKVVIGNCNGAQVLVESGLIPLGGALQMSLARNAIKTAKGYHAPGFLSEWVWMKPLCAKDRCATSNWDGAMHMPIAHGEGRFVTEDKDLFGELKKNGQLAFGYCDENGAVSDESDITPNGSTYGAAGICNAAGNVVAIMPHPERTPSGDPYFVSIRQWIEAKRGKASAIAKASLSPYSVPARAPRNVEVFIDTIIVNNEERTVEQTAKRNAPQLKLKQWKYLCLTANDAAQALQNLSIFNPHKERAYVRRGTSLFRWNADRKAEEALPSEQAASILSGTLLLRRDRPDTGAEGFAPGAETGVCYACMNVDDGVMTDRRLLEIFANPHASSLEKLI